MRHCPAILLAATMVVALAVGARAATGDCPALEARLASLDRTSDDYWDNDLRNTQAAIDRQRAELEQAMTAARRAGCYGGLLFGREPGNQCAGLIARVDRIGDGIQRLQTERQAVAGDPYGAERERSRVVRELVANQCGDRAAFERGGRRRIGLLTIFGGGRSLGSSSGAEFGGMYRTLCVRTCDGYYFPISFSASAAAFGRDESACRAMCPGTDVALYVHRNPGGQTSEMVSLAGEPYTALPTAFRYRREYDRACTCPAIAGDGSAPAPVAATVVVAAPPLVVETHGGVLTIAPAVIPEPAAGPLPEPRPLARPDGDTDPETAENRAGSFAPGTAAADPVPVTVKGPGGAPIRVVGPASPFTVE